MAMATAEPKTEDPNTHSEAGATVLEYAIILSLILLVCYVTLVSIGQTTSTKYTPVVSALN